MNPETDARAAAPAPDQLAWLTSWDGWKHAFTRRQPGAEFAVLALCGHISRPASLTKGDGAPCLGCATVMGEGMGTDDRWR